MTTPEVIRNLADAVGGKVDFCVELTDGSGAAGMPMPLPKDHWIYQRQPEGNVPPMPLRMGTDDPGRKDWEAKLRAAGQYAVRCATMNGRETDFDPDALIQQLIVGMLGYYTPDGLSRDSEMNP